ncbi:Isca1 [Symbiodinium natans]|uniref:Isca1 protein n=1 Tax=Symbiodinium natans TaxID=878477 RepID=A0A812R365_9DINO|nr:Isca1 [Symbiodinium natans]
MSYTMDSASAGEPLRIGMDLVVTARTRQDYTDKVNKFDEVIPATFWSTAIQSLCSEFQLHRGQVVEADGGIKVVVDSKAVRRQGLLLGAEEQGPRMSKVMFLIGTEMDFVSNEVGNEFVFNNPNKKSECGCGQSFNV